MTNFVRLSGTCAFVALLTVSAFAQDVSNPFTSGEKGLYNYIAQAVIAAAEKMPEENYAFKPTTDVRSFGELVAHAGGAQRMFCGMISGQKPPMPAEGGDKMTSKADLIKSLKSAVDSCNQAYAGLTDAQAAQVVKFMGRDMPKLTVLSINSAHLDEHYGNMVTYLRLKGIVPPTSEPHK